MKNLLHRSIPHALLWTLMIVIFICSSLCASDISCIGCHAQQSSAEENAIHLQEGIGCVDCHGGDPEKKDRQGAHIGNFSGVIKRQEIPALCASCHSDVRRMNAFGLSTDQYAQYLTSKHGEALQQGKTDVATCIDCHHAHGIRKVRDPRSPVHPKNVPSTCGKCHDDAALMEKHNIPHTAVDLYLQSVHADMLLKKEDLSAPTCATCHGNHGATPPGFAQIRLVCGKCHIRQQELFAESPHAELSDAGIFESCVTCHTNHKILTRFAEIKNQCKDCHEEGDDAMKRRDRIFEVIRASEANYESAAERLAGLTRFGFHTEDEQILLEEAKTSLLQLPPIQHTLKLESVQKTADSVKNTLGDLNARMDKMENGERLKKAALIPIWLFLICMSIIFWAKQKQLKGEGQDGNE